jgi:hypothetical protein
VAIRTANDTFIDLGLQASDRCAANDHPADISEFRTTNVVEVEDQNVAFIAVDTWVAREKVEHQSSIALRIPKMKCITPLIVGA